MGRNGGSPAAACGERLLARAVGLNIAGQAGGFAIGFVYSVLLARALGAHDRGLVAVMIVAGTVTLALVGGGLQVAMQYYAGRRGTSQRGLLGNSLAYSALLAVVLLPAFWALHDPISRLLTHGEGGRVWVLAALLVPLTFLDYSTGGQLCGRLEFGFWNVVLIAARLASLAALALLVVGLGFGIGGALLATATSSVVVVSIGTARLLREGRPRLDLALFRRSVRYGRKAQIGAFFQFLNFRLDVLMLAVLASLTSVGHYVVAQTLAELPSYLGIAFQVSVLPILARFDDDGERAETSTAALRHHGVLALGLAAANAVFAPLVLLFVYGHEFRPALVPLFVLIPGMWFMGTGALVVGDLRGRGRPGLASATKGATALVTIVLDLALIPPFGVVGAAVASTVSYTFFGIASILVLSRVAGVPARRLALPTREDLALYPRALRRLRQRAKGDRLDVVRPGEPLVIGD